MIYGDYMKENMACQRNRKIWTVVFIVDFSSKGEICWSGDRREPERADVLKHPLSLILGSARSGPTLSLVDLKYLAGNRHGPLAGGACIGNG